ncbi:MAG: hypothetical protein WBW33_31785 [Bryobacteraceae bacterium]
MIETERRIEGTKVRDTPLDHSAVYVDANIAIGSRALNKKLAGYSPTPAAKVEDILIQFLSNVREDEALPLKFKWTIVVTHKSSELPRGQGRIGDGRGS